MDKDDLFEYLIVTDQLDDVLDVGRKEIVFYWNGNVRKEKLSFSNAFEVNGKKVKVHLHNKYIVGYASFECGQSENYMSVVINDNEIKEKIDIPFNEIMKIEVFLDE
ncbi:MAG: hypothetical protein PHE05_04075 [Bacilli bacterium]|nr:hypothetical protein [Bacilli bacterium]